MTQLADTCINKFQLRKRTPIIFFVQHCEFAYKISEAKSEERLIHKLKETRLILVKYLLPVQNHVFFAFFAPSTSLF